MIENLKNKYRSMPIQLKATLFYTMIVFLQNTVSLITTPIFTRILTTVDYGTINLYNSWYNILSIFVTLNLAAGVYNNALLDFGEDKNKVTSNFLSISVLLSTIVFLLCVIFRKLVSNLLGLSSNLVFYMCLNFLTLPAWNLYINKQKFDYKYKIPFIISIIIFLLNPILGILGVYLFPTNKAIAKIIFSGLPNVILGFFLIVITYKNCKSFFDKNLWKYALKFNIPLIPHYLSNIILSSSDRIMIARICGEAKAGIYSLSYNISSAVNRSFDRN